MSEFRSLYAALKGWYCKPLFDYPGYLHEMVREVWLGNLAAWGKKTPARKVAYARQWDFEHGPATEAQRDEIKARQKQQGDKMPGYADFEELQNEINYWETRSAERAQDAAIKEGKLAQLKARFAAMDLKRRQILGDPDADDAATITQAIENQGTAPKCGRPRTLGIKAKILHQLIVGMTQDNKIAPSQLPGSAADLLDACQRIERAKTGKTGIFSTTEDTFKTWLKHAGYGFKDGRTPKAEANYWSHLCVGTLGKIDEKIFAKVNAEDPV